VSQTLSHPAVVAAADAVAGFGDDFTPAGLIVRDDELAAVVLDGDRARFTVMVENHSGTWVAPAYISGTTRPTRPRDPRTTDLNPLRALARKSHGTPGPDGRRPEYGWIAVTGLAAEDAVSVTVTSGKDEQTTPVTSDGLAFALVRARLDERLRISVRTGDGRSVPVDTP
jgi:hypothetical protein